MYSKMTKCCITLFKHMCTEKFDFASLIVVWLLPAKVGFCSEWTRLELGDCILVDVILIFFKIKSHPAGVGGGGGGQIQVVENLTHHWSVSNMHTMATHTTELAN